MPKIFVKPLTVNRAWQGKRFRTSMYDAYTTECLLKLPDIVLPEPPYEVHYVFGLSTSLADWDNPIKPFQDILQKRYGFNDKDIFRAVVEKVKTHKGAEFVYFDIKNLTVP